MWFYLKKIKRFEKKIEKKKSTHLSVIGERPRKTSSVAKAGKEIYQCMLRMLNPH